MHDLAKRLVARH